MTRDDPQGKRLERLTQELLDEGVTLADVLPSSLLQDGSGLGVVYEELLHALHVPKHEGHRPPYGCLITTRPRPETDLVEAIPIQADTRLDDARALADGRDLILCRDTRGQISFLHDQILDELSAVRLVRNADGAIVQRLESGIVKIVGSRGVLSVEGREWVQQPSAAATLGGLPSRLVLPAGGPNYEQLLALLELCFHRLSPLGIGATFVLDLTGDGAGLLATLTDEGERPVMRLNVFEAKSHVGLRNLLAMADGACIIASTGEVQRYEVKLSVSETAQGFVRQHGGTRHTSAKRYTFDHDDVIAVVVSADGPVTLFSDGAELLKIDRDKPSLSWLLREPLRDLQDMVQTSENLQCVNCQKLLRIRVVRHIHNGRRATMKCPVCTIEIETPEDTIDAQARPAKPWEPKPTTKTLSVRDASSPAR